MFTINNFMENPNIVKKEAKGCFEVYEYQKDLSVTPSSAVTAYYMSQMNCKKRQVLCKLDGNSVRTQAGAMQWMAGRVTMDSNVKSVGDFFGKALKNLGTGESISKPEYTGCGYLMLEPTYRFILIEDVSSWGEGMVIEEYKPNKNQTAVVRYNEAFAKEQKAKQEKEQNAQEHNAKQEKESDEGRSI